MTRVSKYRKLLTIATEINVFLEIIIGLTENVVACVQVTSLHWFQISFAQLPTIKAVFC